MDSPTANLIQILRERVDALVEQGNYDEAIHAASAAIEKAQQTLSPDYDSIDQFVEALELRADLHRSVGNLDDACEDYYHALDQLENRPDRKLVKGKLLAALGAVYDAKGDEQRTAELWEKAIDAFETSEPPSPLDVASLSNNLAYLKKNAGDTEGAETQFLKALEILHREVGPDHEETATISNNLGALYHSASYFEQAREMHMMALETRRKLFGEDHPDTAQSHNNLALALLETGDRSWARRHFDKALHAFQALGEEYAEDLEAVAENYCQFLRAEGENLLADRIESQLREGSPA